MHREKNIVEVTSPSLGTIGFIVWLVFLILKLCNQGNPDFEWLTWFWVWFPFWLPIAIEFVFGVTVFTILMIIQR